MFSNGFPKEWSTLRKLMWLYRCALASAASYATVTGVSPLTLVNALAKPIRSLAQYGKVTTSGGDIYCNNGKLVAVDDELPSGYKRLLGITFDGNFHYRTGEYLKGDDDVTMTLDNLSASGKNVFGSYNGANDKNFSMYIYGSSTTGSYFRYGDQLKRPKYGGTGRRTITFGKNGTTGFADDSEVTPDEFTTPANTYIGMLPNSSSAAFTGDIIGSITVSNRLEWIPCENPGGVIGYYEKYSGNFIAPTGSGTPVSLGYDTSHMNVLAIEGTPEVLTIGEDTASGAIASFETTKAAPARSLLASITPIQSGSGDPSPDNVRPISGWTGANVTRTGKNLARFRAVNSTWNGITMRTDGSSIAISGTPTSNASPWSASTISTYETMGNGPFPAGTYTLSCRGFEMQVVYDRITVQAKYADGSSVSGVNGERISPSTAGGSPNDKTFTATKPFKMDFWINIQKNSTVDFTATIQLELGSTVTAYEPYQGETYTITFPSSAGTVYGGTLDVATGKLTVDMAMLGNVNWSKHNSYSHVFYAPAGTGQLVNSTAGVSNVCVLYSGGNLASFASDSQYRFRIGDRIYINIPSVSNVTDLNTWITNNSLQICFELANPIVYDLTPTEVSTLLGTNNVWSDTGDVTVTYAPNGVVQTASVVNLFAAGDVKDEQDIISGVVTRRTAVSVSGGEITISALAEPVTERVTVQPLRTAEGGNNVSVTSNADPVELSVEYAQPTP